MILLTPEEENKALRESIDALRQEKARLVATLAAADADLWLLQQKVFALQNPMYWANLIKNQEACELLHVTYFPL